MKPDLLHQHKIKHTACLLAAAIGVVLVFRLQGLASHPVTSDLFVPVLACNADFTYQVDTLSSGLHLYTFKADTTDSSKTYLWDFEGTRQAFGPQVEHIFFDGGTWSVTLTVSDSTGSCSTFQNITVDGSSTSCFFNVSRTPEDTVIFEPFIPFSATPKAYTFNLGDGNVVSDTLAFGGQAPAIRHKYGAPGSYQACLISTNAADSTDSCTFCKQIIIETGMTDTTNCNANFTYTIDSVSVHGLYTYRFTAEDTTGSKDYLWDFEGQRQVSGPEAEHIFEDSGNWTVSLRVAHDLDTCTTFQVINPPHPERCFFNLTKEDNLVRVEPWTVFSANTQPYSIDFGDGTIINDTTASGGSLPVEEHFYSTPGNYQVCLRVTESPGDTCVFCQPVVIGISGGNTCNAGFTYVADSLQQRRFIFTADEPDSTNHFTWTVTGGFQSSGPVLDYLFPDAGVWTVSLMVNNGTDSCATSQTIVVDSVATDSLYIQGMLFADLQRVNNGVLDLYKKKEGQWYKHGTTQSAAGTYRFSGLSKGRYLIHALGNKNDSSTFIPTYFVNGLGWQDAYEIDLIGSAEEVNITLIRSQHLAVTGQGTLAGNIAVDDQLPENDDYVILLKDATTKRAIRWSKSSSDKTFQFDQLPFGAYELTVERPSLIMQQSFVLNEDQPEIRDIQLSNGRITGLEETLIPNSFKLYPTLVTDHVIISNNGENDDVLIHFRSTTGKTFFTLDVSMTKGEVRQLELPAGLPPGLYFMMIQKSDDHFEVHKLIKN